MIYTTKKTLITIGKKTKKNTKLKSNIQYVNKILEFLNNNIDYLKKNKFLEIKKNSELFNVNKNDKNCICQNILNKKIDKKCNCSNLEKYKQQGYSGANIYSITCKNNNEITQNKNNQIQSNFIVKTLEKPLFYFKYKLETPKYIYLEIDRFTLQTIISILIHDQLPHNSLNIIQYGLCKKGNYQTGYNVMNEADLGTSRDFLVKLFDNTLIIPDLQITKEIKHKIFINLILQVIYILGHLHQSHLKLFHGDTIPTNFFVKTLSPVKLKHFTYKINNKTIKLKNLGFAVLIADLEVASVSIYSKKESKTYRIGAPLSSWWLSEKESEDIYLNKELINLINLQDNYYHQKNINFKNNLIQTISQYDDRLIYILLRYLAFYNYNQFDIYVFVLRLFTFEKIKKYIFENSLHKTLFSFIPSVIYKYINYNNLPIHTLIKIIIITFNKNNITFNYIYTEKYMNTLEKLKNNNDL